jgi:hypothetical protein
MEEIKTEFKDEQGMVHGLKGCDGGGEGHEEECLLEEHPHPFKRKHSILTFVRTQSISQAASRFNAIALSERNDDRLEPDKLTNLADSNTNLGGTDIGSNRSPQLSSSDIDTNSKERGRQSPGRSSSRGHSPSPPNGSHRTEPFAHQVAFKVGWLTDSFHVYDKGNTGRGGPSPSKIQPFIVSKALLQAGSMVLQKRNRFFPSGDLIFS